MLKNDSFFDQLFFKNNVESKFKEYFDGWLNKEIGMLASFIYAIYIRNNVKKYVYEFNDKNIEEYIVADRAEGKRIIDEVENVLNKIKKTIQIDISTEVRRKLYFFVLNGFLIKLCFSYHKYRMHINKSKFIERMKQDLLDLEDYFQASKFSQDNLVFSQSVDKFKFLMFETNAIEDSSTDKILHLVYKLRKKRKSFFG